MKKLLEKTTHTSVNYLRVFVSKSEFFCSCPLLAQTEFLKHSAWMQNTLREFKGRVAIGNADLIYNKRVLYQNKVNLILTFTHRLGYLANNCKMVYWFLMHVTIALFSRQKDRQDQMAVISSANETPIFQGNYGGWPWTGQSTPQIYVPSTVIPEVKR